MQVRLRKSLTGFLIAMVTVTVASAGRGSDEKAQPRVTGTYTDMRYVLDAGDVVGTEVKIVFTGSELEGALQIAEGAPGQLTLVHVKQDGNSISFAIPDDSSYAGSFHGSITAGVLRGNFKFKSGGSETVVLRRGKSYWD